jgi:type IV secretory pathway VirB10-like protein
MATTTMPQNVKRQLATRSHGWRIALVVMVVLGGAIGAAIYLLRQQRAAVKEVVPSAPVVRTTVAEYYEPKVEPKAATAAPVDRTAEALQKLQTDMLAMKLKLEALEKQKAATAPPTKEAPKPVVKRPAPMLYEHKDVQEKVDTPPSKGPLYTLAAWATHLPCVIEPLMVSEVPGAFTAKVTANVKDTKTGRHILVPQGATIGGQDHGGSLLYGNERLPTVSLALTIEDRTYDLQQAPMMDQRGTNGLTGDVDQHFWRLFGAVFIGGALRGGQQMLQMEMAQAGGAGQVATGIAGIGNQVAGQRLGRALDTRPTITVFPGQTCSVLLTKSLSLPAVWE